MDQRNELLQKALALYFTEVAQVKFLGKAQVALTAMHDARFQYERPDRYNPLANYRLTWLAPNGEWVELHPAPTSWACSFTAPPARARRR